MTRERIDRLLQLRSKLRASGTRCLPTLIDLVISKVGSLVLFTASDLGEIGFRSTRSESLEGQMEYDTVRAASQLPDCWSALPLTLTLNHVSPASKRLIIRLLFGAFVIQPDLDGSQDTSTAHLPPDILPALEAIIEEYVVFDAVTGSPIIFKDELDRAFFLNLYATVQSAVQRSSSDLADNRVICKPYIESHLLALIDSILYPKDKRPNSALMSAHAVCFGWGKLVPWTWETWVDRRCANTESVTAVTLRWLETIDCGAACSNHRTCRLALTRMSENAFSSFAALSNALGHVVGQLQASHESQSGLLRSSGQLCSFMLLVLREVTDGCNCRLPDYLWRHGLKACRGILLLCIKLDWNTAKDDYLDLLLSMDEGVVRQSLTELQTDRATHFSRGLDHVFSEVKGYLSKALILPAHISVIRFALGFLTILCNGGIRGIILRENISSFFLRLYNRLIIGDRHDEYGKMLLGPLVTALMAAERYFSPSRPFTSLTDDGGLWRLCLKQSCDNFSSTSRLYPHVILTTG